MARELLTSWGDFQLAVDRLLALAEREILVYDDDLARFKLEGGPRLDCLKRLLQPRRQNCLRIALQKASTLQRSSPRLMRLLADYSGCMTVLETPDHLNHLRDSMLLVDGRHGIVLFDRNQARLKLLVDETRELEPYLQRFEELWQEGGSPLSATTLGL